MNEERLFLELSALRDALPDDGARRRFDERYLASRKNPVILYGFSYFLGWLGIDRFVLGDWGLGLGKLIVAGIIPLVGGFMSELTYNDAWELLSLGYIWMAVDWFLIGGATRTRNSRLAVEIRKDIA